MVENYFNFMISSDQEVSFSVTGWTGILLIYKLIDDPRIYFQSYPDRFNNLMKAEIIPNHRNRGTRKDIQEFAEEEYWKAYPKT
jgi:hypothetical protein